MAFNFLERLGGLFGRSPAAPTEPAPAEAAPEPVPEPVAEAPVAEPYTPPVPYTALRSGVMYSYTPDFGSGRVIASVPP